MRLVASKLSKKMICQHLRLDPEFVDAMEWRYIQGLKNAAIAYICDHCAISAAEVDACEDLAICTLVLISDMYDERATTVDSAHDNRTVATLLAHHDRNFLGAEDGDDCAIG